MSSTIFGITLEAWQYWPVIFGIVVLAGFVWWAHRKRAYAISILSSTKRRSVVFKNYSAIRVWVKLFCLVVALFLLFFSLLRPQWGLVEQNVEQEGRDLMIALDVSRSMLAQDYKPNRLDFAKNKIKELVRYLDCERVGLMLFSGRTFVQCPLTSDFASFFMFLDQVDAETISSGSTALDSAIAKALELFKRNSDRKNKLLVLFTDGEDFSSNLAQVKQDAIQQQLHIVTVGVGTPEGAPIPIVDMQGKMAGHQKDEKGSVVISRLNEGILENLSAASGGQYIRATENKDDIKRIIKYVRTFEKEKFDDKIIASSEDRYPYFAAVALICLLIEWML